MEWLNQIRALVYQSFNIFNIYGREPESLESILFGFTVALEDIELKYITKAFKEWLQQSSSMPTPADIRKSALEWQDIEAERELLKDRPKLENHNKMGEKQPIKCVPWAFMSYEAISKNKMMGQVTDWINDELKPLGKHDDYIKYLKDFCGFPQNFTGKSEL